MYATSDRALFCKGQPRPWVRFIMQYGYIYKLNLRSSKIFYWKRLWISNSNKRYMIGNAPVPRSMCCFCLRTSYFLKRTVSHNIANVWFHRGVPLDKELCLVHGNHVSCLYKANLQSLLLQKFAEVCHMQTVAPNKAAIVQSLTFYLIIFSY